MKEIYNWKAVHRDLYLTEKKGGHYSIFLLFSLFLNIPSLAQSRTNAVNLKYCAPLKTDCEWDTCTSVEWGTLSDSKLPFPLSKIIN